MTETTIQQFQLRLPSDLKQSIEKEAEHNNRSINAQILFMLQNYEENNGRVHFLSESVLHRLERFQKDNNYSSQVEAIEEILNDTLQKKDNGRDILNELHTAFKTEKNLRTLAKNILSSHLLVKNIIIEDNNFIEFTLADGSQGKMLKDGKMLYKSSAKDNYSIYTYSTYNYK
ncbi:unnamed protein product [Commensalibacter communis]|uniref:Arc-like DNA binding domain-containing protein n=1 Tax=Commensalibacter communis TaxID=2972786 RepID=A0A9W4TNM7_9PROT|nr:Arc family DNA-binding protein [Commensalibacter communis]CAI3941638.1 unnamed protein product [Commensalibacter communis]CAI3944988.1 unnamed protein product [Commensalibacter communis]CAI3959173.1 unnamed protein product [Commensalibacter communis]CAI3960896.1 unnamed protein product [Commensalibacter communis]